MANRGYVVSPKHLAALEIELRRVGITYRIVHDPCPLISGAAIKPVLVWEGVKPKGWVRFGTRTCGHYFRISSDGDVISETSCHSCYTAGPKLYWERLESASLMGELRLPGWVSDVGVRTVADVRQQLRDKELPGVGPEREAEVTKALDDWRAMVRRLIAD